MSDVSASILTLGSWVHNLSPFLVEVVPGKGLRWYGISYVLGFVIAYFILQRLAKQGRSPLPAHKVADAMLVLIFVTIVGGRLGYVLFYDVSSLTDFSSRFPFWGVLNLAQGGMAYHGALMGVFVGSLYVYKKYCVRDGWSWSALADVLALACTVGLGLGRLANFINGELLGKVVAAPGEAGPWWSVRFPQELGSGHAPTLSSEQTARLESVLLQYALPSDASLSDALDRLTQTIQTGGAAGAKAAADIGPLLASRYPSQLLQAFFEGVVLTAVLWIVWVVAWRRQAPRAKAGVVAACFVLVYGALRIVAEFYRLPDAQLGAQALGLSRGQWLSAAMVAIGAAWLAIALRSNRGGAEKLLG